MCLDWLIETGAYSSEKLCVFEHGGDISTSCSCVDHCHLHVINCDVGLYDRIEWNKDQENHKIDSTTRFDDITSYLLIGIYEYKTIYIDAKVNFRDIQEHQYFRRRIGEILNDDVWSWKTGMNYNWIDRLVGDIKSRQ